MTTSAQPNPLDTRELAALRALARDPGAAVDDGLRETLIAKGMLDNTLRLTPAGEHATHVGDDDGVVPGIDN